VLVIVGVLVVAFVVARGCQQSQIRITKQQAVATATRAVDFNPRGMTVRLLRQGLNSKPAWFVNLSVPGEAAGSIRRLSVVEVDANTGEVVEISKQR
jgi:NAD(P)H-flavin reductase